MYFPVFKEVFKNIKYIFIALVIFFITFSISVTLFNWGFIFDVFQSDSASLFEKLKIFFSLYESINTNFTKTAAVYTLLIDILLGINVAMIIYYIRQRRGGLNNKATATGLGGIVAGLFGIGCAACGSFLLSSFLVLFGAGGLIAYLPFSGEEFGFLGVGLLLLSLHLTTKKIKEPLVC